LSIKKQLLSANKEIVDLGLVKLTWGNVSARQDNKILIKPSGVDLQSLDFNDISIVNFNNILLGGLKQSVDTPSHIEIYRHFHDVNAIVHTHSKYATSFAQSKTNIPCLGTTHADYFRYEIPVVNEAKNLEKYEKSTGESIVNFFIENNIDPLEVPAALCPGHGVFAWGVTIEEAVKHALVLELVAEMSYNTMMILSCKGKQAQPIASDISDKHFLRKHGKEKYYGQ
jgi:L-ribulose-5-phosphate 4-epimerase